MPYDILKSHLPQLCETINAPDRLANDLYVFNVIARDVQRKILNTPSLGPYDKASILVNEVLNSLKVFKDDKKFVKFCDVLKSEDNPDLRRIANTMSDKLGEETNNLCRYIIL